MTKEDRPRIVMLVAAGLNVVSQFLLYDNDQGRDSSDLSWSNHINGVVGTGWELHGWMAFIPVAVLVVYLMDAIVLTPAFRAIGWWISVVALIAATIDGHPFFDGTPGAKLGWLTVLLALVAAWMNMQAQKKAGSVSPPTAKS